MADVLRLADDFGDNRSAGSVKIREYRSIIQDMVGAIRPLLIVGLREGVNRKLPA